MWKHAVFIVSLAAALAACARQPNAPAGDETPAFDWTNNLDNGNLRITRFESEFITCWSDATNGLRACHSTIPLGDGTETDCGPQAELDPVQVQDVGLFDPDVPFFVNWLHENLKGAVWVTVRDLTQPGTCFDNRLVAEGWGNIHYTDNDLFGVGGPDRNANAWGFRSQGRLTSPAGSRVNYSGHTHFRFNRSADFKEMPPKVEVH